MSTPVAPRVSICIANYNGHDLLPDCIDSILAQTASGSGAQFIEILGHDDASTDDSAALLRARYPHVVLIESAENVGFCIANNRMAAAAKGEYLLLLNNDAALFPDAVASLLAAAEATGPSLLTLPQYAWDSGELINRGCRLDLLYNAVPIMERDVAPCAMLEGACLWLPRATWQSLGGFPDWFGSIAEDAWLCCAARLAGIPVRCLAQSGYRHRQGASFGGNRIANGSLRTSYRRRYLSERNRIALLVSCTPTALVWPWLCVHVAILVAEAVALCAWMRSLVPWLKVYSPALRQAWSLRVSALALRRMTQSGRRIGCSEYLRAFDPMPRRFTLLRRHGLPRFDR